METDEEIDVTGEHDVKSSTPTRGRKRVKKSGRDSTGSISPIGDPPDIEGAVTMSVKGGDTGEASVEGENNKKFKLDENIEETMLDDVTAQDADKDGDTSQSEAFLS